MNTTSKYSPETKAKAIQLYKENRLTTKEICSKLDVGYSALRVWAKKAGANRPKGTKAIKSNYASQTRERNEKIAGLYFHHGKTYEEIGTQFGLTRQRIDQILKAKVKDPQIFLNHAHLAEQLKGIYDLEEAAEWANSHKEEFNLEKAPNAEVLKAAAQENRLAAVKKGKVWLTSEDELKVYLANFHPGRGGHRRVKL
jgi:predicted transcriptional regulator